MLGQFATIMELFQLELTGSLSSVSKEPVTSICKMLTHMHCSQALKEVESLRGKLGAHEKDQTSLQDTKTKLKQAQKQLKNLEWENEVRTLAHDACLLPAADARISHCCSAINIKPNVQCGFINYLMNATASSKKPVLVFVAR